MVSPQRWGKTSAAQYIVSAVIQIHGKIPTLFVPMRKDVKSGVMPFFRYLLTLARYQYTANRGRTESDIRNLFTNCVVTRGRRSRHKMFILVIDEAQLLTVQQWNYVFNICNEADALGVNVFVLSVGQPKLLTTEAKLLIEGQEEISERFLQRNIPFRGIRSAEELRSVFSEIDQTCIRRNSSELLVAQYCPIAFSGGWRLSGEAIAFWNAFSAIYSQYQITKIELPMTYLFNAMNQFLITMSSQDVVNWVLPQDIHTRCVEKSGIVSSITSLIRRNKSTKDESGDVK